MVVDKETRKPAGRRASHSLKTGERPELGGVGGEIAIRAFTAGPGFKGSRISAARQSKVKNAESPFISAYKAIAHRLIDETEDAEKLLKVVKFLQSKRPEIDDVRYGVVVRKSATTKTETSTLSVEAALASPRPSDDDWFERAKGEGPQAKNIDVAAEFAAARERGRARIAAILDSEDMLTSQQMADKLGIHRETVNTWREQFKLLGLEGEKRGFRYPIWQLGPNGETMPGLAKLVHALDNLPWATYRFLRDPVPELGGKTGRDLMFEGAIEKVIGVINARSYGSFS